MNQGKEQQIRRFLREAIRKNLVGKRLLLLLGATGVIYLLMLVVTIPMIMHHSEGMEIFDMLFSGYSIDYAKLMLETLGESGRHVYLYQHMPLDMLFPLLFALTFSSILAYFIDKIGVYESRWFYLCLVPIVSAVFDYFENSGIIVMLSIYPDFSDPLVIMTNLFSVIKCWCTTITLVILPVLIIIFGYIRYMMNQEPREIPGK